MTEQQRPAMPTNRQQSEKTFRSPRAGARRHVLKSLNSLRIRVRTMRGWWDITGQVYAPELDRTKMNPMRDRRPEEYPEVDVRYWWGTVAEIDAMIREMHLLRAFCVEEWQKTFDELDNKDKGAS
jgi:hypothetical protein